MHRFLIIFFAILTLINLGKSVYAQDNEVILLEAEGAAGLKMKIWAMPVHRRTRVVAPATAALLLGGVTYISSSGIIAKLLDDLGQVGNRETPVVLSILVIEDLVMAFYLPLMAGLLIGGDAWETSLDVVIAVCAVMVTLFVVVLADLWQFNPAFDFPGLSLPHKVRMLIFAILIGFTLLVIPVVYYALYGPHKEKGEAA